MFFSRVIIFVIATAGGVVSFSTLPSRVSPGGFIQKSWRSSFRDRTSIRSESVLVDSFVESNGTLLEVGNEQDDKGKDLFLATTEIAMSSSILPDVVPDEDRMEIVEAVLAMSKDASEKVESNFNTDIAEKLDTSLVLSLNESTVKVATNSDVKIEDFGDILVPSDDFLDTVKNSFTTGGKNVEFLTPTDNYEPSSNEIDDERLEIVEAILAASEDAATMAEASLPDEVAKGLELNSNIPANSTDISLPVIVEEVPKILTASEVVGEPVTRDKVVAPSTLKILKFAVPAIGVWLCSPLLSMIDTSAVGVLSGTVQQAALNPAVAVTDYAALLIAFLYAATTNLVAASQESERTLPGKPHTTNAMIGAMQLSTFVGLGLGSILFVFARQLLSAIIGNGSVNPAVFAAAMKYVRIRALGMPAAAVIGSAQAGCLGMQDIKSPLYVLAAAAIVNFVGDMAFVRSSNALVGGAAGAAWATVISQYAAMGLFIRWLCKKPQATKPVVMDLTKAIMELTGTPSSDGASRRERFRDSLSPQVQSKNFVKNGGNTDFGVEFNPVSGANISSKKGWVPSIRQKLQSIRARKTSMKSTKKDGGFSVRGLLEGKFRGTDLLRLPSKEVVDKFLPFVVPVTTTQAGRVSGYVAMSHVVSSSLGMTNMAAQQIIVSIFYCLCPIADSLSLTAQSLVPGLYQKKASKERSVALRKTILNILKAGVSFGTLMVGVVGVIPFLSKFFTSDPVVTGLVNMVIPQLVTFFAVHGIMCGMEGMLLAQKDLSFLGKMYGFFFLAVPFFMLRVKKAALAGVQSVNLSTVWKVFIGYQLFRTAAFSFRVASLQRKNELESNECEISEALIGVAP